MRLKRAEIVGIKNTVQKLDPQVRVYLYGSRVDDNNKGRDIDLLLFSKKIILLDKLKIKVDLYTQLGEQKIDLFVTEDASKPFVNMVMEEAILL